MSPALVLASASPRRSGLMRDLGLTFEVRPSHAEEPPPTPEDGRAPGAYVERLALLKARGCEAPGLVIAADTVVVLGETILGKPRDEVEAVAMLQSLRGQTHTVFTGVCVRESMGRESVKRENAGDDLSGRQWCEHEATRVTFGEFSDEFVRAYVRTGEPMDKAGAYAAQGRGALLIARIEGDYFNVVGLPLRRLSQMLTRCGVEVSAAW